MNTKTVPACPTDGAPRSNPEFYVDKAVLSERIREYRRTGVLSDALSLDLLAIAKGVHDRYQFSPDRDDFAADCWIHLTSQAPLRRVDPDKNPFAFFTRCVINFGSRRRAKWYKRLRQEGEYREMMGDHFGEVLSTEDVGDYCPDSIFDTTPDPDDDPA